MIGVLMGVVPHDMRRVSRTAAAPRKGLASMDTLHSLAEEHCEPLHARDEVVHGRQLLDLHATVPDWHIVERDGFACLQRTFHFGSFAEALAFTDRVGALAQAEGHHPTIVTEWGRATVSWWTHALKGLHRNDFIMACKTDQLYAPAHARAPIN
jgi:4a-hydroxytetrahydrobiopterin dehydratase